MDPIQDISNNPAFIPNAGAGASILLAIAFIAGAAYLIIKLRDKDHN